MSPRLRLLGTALLTWVRQSVNFLWLVVVAAYLCVSAGQAVYKSYQSQQETKKLEVRLRQARQEEERLQALLAYYRTDAFKEKELRRTLLYKNPNEKVYALPEASGDRLSDDGALPVVTEPTRKQQSVPIWRQWVEYVLRTGNEA